jgi:hypothetical protein
VDGVLGIGKGRRDFVSQLKLQGMIDENSSATASASMEGASSSLGATATGTPSAGVTWFPMVKEYR